MNLTPVVFTFYTPQGEPVGETDFTIQLIRPGFDQQVGVVFPETIYMTTDSSGSATVMLAPSNTPYFVKVDGPEFCSQLSYRFYVVESDVPVNFQDLIDMGQLNPVDVTQEIIRLILEAKVHSAQSALEAKISAAAALVSELSAKDFEIASKQNELASKAFAEAAQLAQVAAQGHADSALASKNAAKVSETNAKTSETNAKSSETASKASQTATKTSETNAKASETAAAGSAFTATTKASEASASASAAKASELLAAGSEQRTTSLKDSVEATNVIVQQTKSDMEALYAQALLIGSGWSPVIRVVADGSRYVLQVTDWTGGKGTKPAVGYMGATGIVAAIGSASDIRGAKGIDGTSFQVNATGTLAGRDTHNAKPAGFAYLATDNGLLYIRETATSGVWSPGIPFGKGDKGDTGDRGPQGLKGDKGDKGDTGATGPVNKLTIGTVTTGPISSATITGTAPNQTLSLTLQKGDKGDTGDTGLGFTQAQYEKLDGIEAGAQKNVPTNLTRTGHTEFSMNIASSTGSLANIPRASTTLSGLMAASDQVKLNGAAPLASPSFTGTPVAPTPVAADSSTKIATTAFVQGLVTSAGSALNMDNATAGVLAVVRGGTGVTTSTGSGSTVLSISPALGGTPTAPTAGSSTNNTQLATTAFVQAVNLADTGSAATAVKLKTARNLSISGGVTAAAKPFDGSGNVDLVVSGVDLSSASGVLPVSKGGTGVTTSTGTGATVQAVSPVFTGTPTAPTAAATVNTTQLATTAFVQAVNLADTGSAATAVKLKTARSIAISGGATGTATDFDGSGNITIPVTGLNMANANAGTLPVVRGGTGTTTSTGTGANVQAVSPTFTGAPLVPTAAAATNNTQAASTAFVRAAISNPQVASDYRLGAVNTQYFYTSAGWSGRNSEWAQALEANGALAFHSYNNGTYIKPAVIFNKDGSSEFNGMLAANGYTNPDSVDALTQTGEIGTGFANWTGSAKAVIQLNCQFNSSAYFLWRATKQGARHLAAMSVHAQNSDAAPTMVSLAITGTGGASRDNAFVWYGDGDYHVQRNITAGGSITPNSDIRLKNVLSKVRNPMAKLRAIEHIIYTRKDIDNGTRYGYSAQSVEAVMPEAIVRSKPMENQKEFIPDEVLSVDYNGVSVLHGAALVEHDDEIKALKAEIELLKQMVSTLTNK